MAIEHKVKSAAAGSKAGGAVTANALLAFDAHKEEDDDEYYGGRGGRGRGRGGRGGRGGKHGNHHEKQFEIKD